MKDIPFREMIFTGPVDEFFDYRYGKLPYRSLEFKHETHDRELYQDAPVVNYPNDQAYTRITEFKYLTGQAHPKTSIVFEFPRAEGDPYYPVPRKQNAELYAQYKELADADPGRSLRRTAGNLQVLQHGPSHGTGADDLRKNHRDAATGGDRFHNSPATPGNAGTFKTDVAVAAREGGHVS